MSIRVPHDAHRELTIHTDTHVLPISMWVTIGALVDMDNRLTTIDTKRAIGLKGRTRGPGKGRCAERSADTRGP